MDTATRQPLPLEALEQAAQLAAQDAVAEMRAQGIPLFDRRPDGQWVEVLPDNTEVPVASFAEVCRRLGRTDL